MWIGDFLRSAKSQGCVAHAVRHPLTAAKMSATLEAAKKAYYGALRTRIFGYIASPPNVRCELNFVKSQRPSSLK